MSIAKYLQSGTMVINAECRYLEIVETGQKMIYDNITSNEWGIVYEKYVGQLMKGFGYNVTYNMSKGYFDGGIDIIAENDNHKLFIQCKMQQKHFNKQHIEWILYKASNTLLKEWKNRKKHLCFVLVTHDKNKNFLTKGKRYKDSLGNGLKYPWLTHFLNANNTQNKIKVYYREIPFPH